MEIKRYDLELSVLKVTDYSEVNNSEPFVFTAKTDNELSLVCSTSNVPRNTTAREDGWKMMRVQGNLDFSLVGILANITAILADNGISVFAISTFDTDYILVKKETYEAALAALAAAGYTVVS